MSPPRTSLTSVLRGPPSCEREDSHISLAQRRSACLVFFDESALSLTPNVRRTWAPRGQPPTLTHPFNWKKASMAAALCYGVRGGGAQLAFHVTLATTTPTP